MLPAKKRCLDLAGLDTEPAQLHLRVRAAQELKHPVTTPPPKVPGPVHPAPRSTIRIRNKPLRRQPKPPQIAPRNATTRNVKLPRNAHRNRQQTAVQDISPIV